MLCCLSSIGVVLTQLPEGLEETSFFMSVCCVSPGNERLGTGFRETRSHCWRKAPGARDAKEQASHWQSRARNPCNQECAVGPELACVHGGGAKS